MNKGREPGAAEKPGRGSQGKSARIAADGIAARRRRVPRRGTHGTQSAEKIPHGGTVRPLRSSDRATEIGAALGVAASDSAGREGDAWSQRLAEHRSRQASVATILERLAGPLSACRPHLWGKRAWWMLIGLIYERLATDAEGISTGDLLTMARVLTESAEGADRKRASGRKSRRAREAALPDVVRRLYGIELRGARAGSGAHARPPEPASSDQAPTTDAVPAAIAAKEETAGAGGQIAHGSGVRGMPRA